MSEAQFSGQVADLIARLSLTAYHTYDSRRSQPGFPDWVICGPHGILFRELKTATGKVTKAQSEWLTKLRLAGGDASVWRPPDLISGLIWRELRGIAIPTTRTPLT